MFTGEDAPMHWLIIAILVMVLFGYKKLPDAARSLGRSLRIFKTEINGMTDDDKKREAAKTDRRAGNVATVTTLPKVEKAPDKIEPAEPSD